MSTPIDLRGQRPTLRVVDEATLAPIADDETAIAELNRLWREARAEYADLLGKVAPLNLRWLVTGVGGRGLRRGEFVGMAKAAREIAAHATALADRLDRAVSVFERRDARPTTPTPARAAAGDRREDHR